MDNKKLINDRNNYSKIEISDNKKDNSQKIHENKNNLNVEDNFLTELRHNRDHLKIDKKVNILVYFSVFALVSLQYIQVGDEIWKFSIIGQNLFFAVIFFWASIMTKKIPKDFQSLVLSSRNIFHHSTDKNDNFLRFKIYVKKKFSSKHEKVLGFLGGIIIFILILYGRIELGIGYEIYDGNLIISEKIHNILYILDCLFYAFIWLILIPMIYSSVFLLISSFMCIKKLGSDDFLLHVSYEELNIGTFSKIGIFVIKYSIFSLIITGLMDLIAFGGIRSAYISKLPYILEFIAGFVIISLISFLLYINTLNIHNEIVKAKNKWKQKIFRNIQNEMQLIENDKTDYDKILKLNSFLKEIKQINDWPFDPGSIKKFLITVGSAISPMIISLFTDFFS